MDSKSQVSAPDPLKVEIENFSCVPFEGPIIIIIITIAFTSIVDARVFFFFFDVRFEFDFHEHEKLVLKQAIKTKQNPVIFFFFFLGGD
mmetsp:Transcript_4653/g.7477  ORF Transcript_4653/g.7477 Transcript_4653/m.7477 type:complete len:89 (-) Transcript_4653:11-277(-)